MYEGSTFLPDPKPGHLRTRGARDRAGEHYFDRLTHSLAERRESNVGSSYKREESVFRRYVLGGYKLLSVILFQ